MTPAPGWTVVQRIEAETQYPGSRLHLPEQAVDRLIADQFEVIAVGASWPCQDPDCPRPHTAGAHAVPTAVRVGSWILTVPRATHCLPDSDTLFVVATDDITAVLG